MKLSSLLQLLQVEAAAPLVEFLRKADEIDEALGRFAVSLRPLLAEPVFDFFKRSVAGALKHRFTPADITELSRRLAICLPEILAFVQAFEESKRLSDHEREDLATKFYPWALSFLERLGVADPSDVAAPVFVEVLNNYRPSRGDFKTLLFWLLRRRAAGWFRARGRRPICEPFAEDFDPPGPTSAPYLDRAELDKALAQGWSQLNPIDQRLFWLHHVGGFSFPEMAAQSDFIGCPVRQTAMRSRVSRARSKLRPLLLPFNGVTAQELIEAVHRVAKAAGTLSVRPAQPRSSSRAARRRAVAHSRCEQRRLRKVGKNSTQQSAS